MVGRDDQWSRYTLATTAGGSADQLLQGRKVSDLPTIQEIHYEDTPYRK